MAHIFVIAGHGHGDSGATGGGYTEAERVRALAAKIQAYGGSNVTVGDTSRNWYADNGISSLNISKSWQIIELHMDSASASARGGHVIIKSGYNPDKYDKALAEFISGILPGRSQTIVKRSDLANPKRAAAKGYPYRLLECGFISNATDRSIFNSRIDDIAKGILKAFDIPVSGSSSSSSSSSTSSSGSSTSTSTSSNVSSTNYKVKVNTASGVNVRKGAGTGYGIIRAISNGTTCTITKESNGWGYAKEYGGWISLNYTKRVSSTASSSSSTLKVDGYWGKDTTKRLQQIFGTTVDGVVSNQFSCYKAQNPGLDSGWDWKSNPSGYSPLIKAIQKKVGVSQDGHIGPNTIKAIQRWMGCTQDGCFSGPSPCIKKLQQWINNQ